jgi:DeoR/GlpR family transcriptional regulator of sugar metabolism
MTEGQTIFIDGGTTNLALAKLVADPGWASTLDLEM